MGKRGVLADQGWGIAPTYVEKQAMGQGTQHPSAGRGLVDGGAAVRKVTAEGLAPWLLSLP
jgi:hypothetical protein